jgi:protein-L-isoaspartate O-methyltransferase
MRHILALLLLLLLVVQVDAQVFRRSWSGCGNGSCQMCYPQQTQQLYYQVPQYTQSQAIVETAQPLRFAPSPTEVVEVGMAIANPQHGEVVYDLGCGDGRVLVHAVRRYGVGALGIEIDPQTAKLAKNRVTTAGYSRSVTIVVGDATKYPLDAADVIWLYQKPEVIAKLKPMRGRVVSYMHDVPQLEMRRVEWTDKTGRSQVLYVSR